MFALLLIDAVCVRQGRNVLEKVHARLSIPSGTGNQLSFKKSFYILCF